MPDSAQHRADMHTLATNRRAVGKPVWESRVNIGGILHNEDLTFEAKRDRFVAAIKGSKWFSENASEDLAETIEEMEDTDTVEYFDQVLSVVYDLADYDRIWLNSGALARTP